MEITLLKIRRVNTNSDPELRAVCDIQIVFGVNEWVVIREFKVLEQDGELSVKIPGRKWTNQQGKLVRAKTVSLPSEILTKIETIILGEYTSPNLNKGNEDGTETK